MKKIITAAAIAAIMATSTSAFAGWDMPFFGDNDSNYSNDNRWNNDGYGNGEGRGQGRGNGKGRGSFNFSMSADADADADSQFDGSNAYYGRGYNNMDNRYYAQNGQYGAPYGYGYAPAAPVAPVAAAPAVEAPAAK